MAKKKEVEEEVVVEEGEVEVTEYPCPNPTCGHSITESPCKFCGR